MAEQIDARGLLCPQPVVLTKKKLEEIKSGILDVLVDNRMSSENVARFAKNAGCGVTIEEKEGIYAVHITKEERGESVLENNEKETVIFVRSDTIGSGDDELGSILMRSFFPSS